MIIDVAHSKLYIGPSVNVQGQLGLFTNVKISPNTYIGTYVGTEVDQNTYDISCSTVQIKQRKDRYLLEFEPSPSNHPRGNPCRSYPGQNLRTLSRSILVQIARDEVEISDVESHILSKKSLIDEIIYVRRKHLSSFPFNRPEDWGLHFNDRQLVHRSTRLRSILYIDPTDENGFIDPEKYFHLYPCFINEPNAGTFANVFLEETGKGNLDFISSSWIEPTTELLSLYS
jgi:hypothetical protein